MKLHLYLIRREHQAGRTVNILNTDAHALAEDRSCTALCIFGYRLKPTIAKWQNTIRDPCTSSWQEQDLEV